MSVKKILIIIILFSLILPGISQADGFVFKPMPDGDLSQMNQRGQQAFINYHGGREELIIGVDIEERDSQAVWIVPVPSKPGEVDIDITSELPVFFGDEINSKAELAFSDSMESAYNAGLLGQIWTLPIAGISLVALRSAGGGSYGEAPPSDLITVEKHIEKKGMTAEIITSKKAEALYNYLERKGINIKEDSIPKLENYIGKEYAFIVSWLSPEENTKGESRGIHVSFPSSEIYYPLYLTSAYGEEKIPITIRVLGHVEPDLFSEIEPYTTTEYFTNRTEPASGHKAKMARCTSYAGQTRALLEIYYGDHDGYPYSLNELNEMENYEGFVEAAKGECWGPIFYQGGGEDYQAQFYLSPEKVYEITSEGTAKAKDVSEVKSLFAPSLNDFYQDSKVWKGKDNYTKITINAPANALKEDLSMKEGRPFKVSFALWIANNSPTVTLLGYIIVIPILSFLIAGFLGLLYFGKFKKYSLLGLTNTFTLVAFYFALRRTKLENEDKHSRRNFLFAFTIIFVALLWALMLLPIEGLENIEENWLEIIAISWILLGALTLWTTNRLHDRFNIESKSSRRIFFVVGWAVLTYIARACLIRPEWLLLIFPIIMGLASALIVCWIGYKFIRNKSRAFYFLSVLITLVLFNSWLLRKVLGEDLIAHLYNLIRYPGSLFTKLSIIALLLSQALSIIFFLLKKRKNNL